MYDKGKIIPGLIVFLGLMLFPIWYNRGDAGVAPVPEKAVGATECVQPAQYMRTTHMQLLNNWRDDVVRYNGNRFATTEHGTQYERSLQKGCMKCHASKKKFCDKCHEYAAVKGPYCWDCHIAPKETN